MTASEKQIALARYRIKQAEETIDDAEFLLSGQKSPRSIINRAYYGMFYGVLALLIFEPYASSKHSGILSYFNKRFIKEGILPLYIFFQSDYFHPRPFPLVERLMGRHLSKRKPGRSAKQSM